MMYAKWTDMTKPEKDHATRWKVVERFTGFQFKVFQMKEKTDSLLIKEFSASREQLFQTVIGKLKPMTLTGC